jgi:hypothetical protein
VRVLAALLSACVLALCGLAAAPSFAAVRMQVDWNSQLGSPGPILYVTTVTRADNPEQLAVYNGGTAPCGVPSGTFCSVNVPGARWIEANPNAAGKPQRISLEADGPPARWAFWALHPGFVGQPLPWSAPITANATILGMDGQPGTVAFSLVPGDRKVIFSDPLPPKPPSSSRRKLTVERTFPLRIGVIRNRVVGFKGMNMVCGTNERGFDDPRPCVAYGDLAPLKVIGNEERWFPVLGRFRIEVQAGQSAPITVKLSRFGVRWLKRHGRTEVMLKVRYAVLGQELPACLGPKDPRTGQPDSSNCRQKTSKFRAKLRLR